MGNCCLRINRDRTEGVSPEDANADAGAGTAYITPAAGMPSFWERRRARQSARQIALPAVARTGNGDGEVDGDLTQWDSDVHRILGLLAAARERDHDGGDTGELTGNYDDSTDRALPVGVDALLELFVRASQHTQSGLNQSDLVTFVRRMPSTRRLHPEDLDCFSFCIAYKPPAAPAAHRLSEPHPSNPQFDCTAAEITCAVLDTNHGGADDERHHCAVCMSAFVSEDVLRVLPCLHRFHRSCVDQWLVEGSGTCPICREDPRKLVERGNQFAGGAPVSGDETGVSREGQVDQAQRAGVAGAYTEPQAEVAPPGRLQEQAPDNSLATRAAAAAPDVEDDTPEGGERGVLPIDPEVAGDS